MWCCCFVSTDDGFTSILDRFPPSEIACLPFRRLECRQPSASHMAQSYEDVPGGLRRERGMQLTDRRGWGRWVCHPGCCVSGNHSASSDPLLKMSVATQAYRRQPACGAATANGRPPGLKSINVGPGGGLLDAQAIDGGGWLTPAADIPVWRWPEYWPCLQCDLSSGRAPGLKCTFP